MDQAEQLRNIIKATSQPRRPLARVITVTSGKISQDGTESDYTGCGFWIGQYRDYVWHSSKT